VHCVPEELAARIAAATHVVALTGSGISAESGVPTFRDAQSGLWAEYSPEELATPEAFARNPKLVWDWYAWRRELVARAEPNAGHRALVALAGQVPAFTLITQNVDGLHQRAGSRDVIEFHGNIARLKCSREGRVVDAPVHRSEEAPPLCPRCGAYVRPDVVWFGEMIPPQALERACAAAERCDVFLSIGTSAQVYPAAGLAEMAQAAGAWLVEINPQPTPQSRYARYLLSGAAGEILPTLVAAVRRPEQAAVAPD
jgi:NAD-dependent protein deacetylase/lipoamidase